MITLTRPYADRRIRLSGFESRDDAESRVQDLRETFELGYGFWVVEPIAQSEDGTWSFMYDHGDTSD